MQHNPDAISSLEWRCIFEAANWVRSNQDNRAYAAFERFALSIPGEACALMLHWIEVFEQADRITMPRREETRH